MSATDFYDDYWSRRTRPSAAWDQKRVTRVLGPLLGLGRILDYGCGIGKTYRPILSSSVGHYSGADVSRVALQTLDAATQSAYPIDPETSRITADDALFDGACSIEVLEHLPDPLAAARELFRVLKPGGVLVATVPNFGYHAWRLMALLRAEVPSEPERPLENRFNGVHIRFYNTRSFARLFRDAGFQNVSIGSFDDSSIWDITRGLGPLAAVSDFARRHLPPLANLRFLQEVCPALFAYRIRAVALKR
ncbi:MAG: class I SAM-dependent methyltransferase [Terrimicrobiaceae bacterium]|nr:class I SAM-dependent methyltransferase [Terrimicrobiaceae bacterium]